jgi:hypothetical protein
MERALTSTRESLLLFTTATMCIRFVGEHVRGFLLLSSSGVVALVARAGTVLIVITKPQSLP